MAKLKKIIAAIMVCATITLTPVSIQAKSYIPNTIRIGLCSNWNKVAEVDIKNNQLAVGYMQAGQWVVDGMFTSMRGFYVRATDEYYLEARDTYTSYQEAQAVVETYKQLGYKVCAANHGPMQWTIYFGAYDSKSNARTYKHTIESGIGQSLQLIQPSSRRIQLNVDGRVEAVFDAAQANPMFQGMDQLEPAITDLGQRKYRGFIEFVRSGNAITPVNVIDMKSYLYGVVAKEMVPSWEIEALKAQAVAARTYAAKNLGLLEEQGYDITDTTRHQVYGGNDGETSKTNKAVDETQGQLLYYKNELTETMYFSSSGGYTESSENVWSNKLPYLRAVPDQYETKPEVGTWQRTFTTYELQDALRQKGVNIGQVKGMRVSKYALSGRAQELEIIGSRDTYTIEKENIRWFFSETKKGSLRSRLFQVSDGSMPKMMDTVTLLGSDGIKRSSVYLQDVYYTTDTRAKKGLTDAYVKGERNTKHFTVIKTPTQDGDILIEGRGFGHGVGMSQSGAQGMAEAGYTYDQILTYYYTGTHIESK